MCLLLLHPPPPPPTTHTPENYNEITKFKNPGLHVVGGFFFIFSVWKCVFKNKKKYPPAGAVRNVRASFNARQSVFTRKKKRKKSKVRSSLYSKNKIKTPERSAQVGRSCCTVAGGRLAYKFVGGISILSRCSRTPSHNDKQYLQRTGEFIYSPGLRKTNRAVGCRGRPCCRIIRRNGFQYK